VLVRSVPFGEADVVATFFTASRGIVGTVARGARRSSKRFAALEPMHGLQITFLERVGAELATLSEASIVRVRSRLTGSLEALEGAGIALRWIRRALPAHTPELNVWHDLETMLDALDRVTTAPHVLPRVGGFGLRLLAELGWGLELERCVSCSRSCDEGASAFADAARGGLVCRACGGGPIILRAGRRAHLAAAAAGDDEALDEDDARAAIDLVDAALVAHTR
jgi:DNA repair protein RecO (recombination protein O)